MRRYFMSQPTDHSPAAHRDEVFPRACVDVLIAARDRSDTIERALLSALAQDEVRTVIVVDDGSIDDTAARARQCDLTGDRIIVHRLDASVGPAAARNVAIGISTAPWLAMLDADDFFLSGRIGMLLSQSRDWDFVADDVMHVQEHQAVPEWSRPVKPDGPAKSRQLTLEQFVLGNVTRPNSHRKELGYLKPLVRREFLDSHTLRYDEALRFGEDYVLYARALAAGARFLVISTAGYVAVERINSLSGRHTRQDLETLRAHAFPLTATRGLNPNERAALAKHLADIDRRTQWLVVVEALQSRNYLQVLDRFLHSPAMALYLTERLVLEIPRQIRKRVKQLFRQ
jgi:succinoglycan biosynthesis protein ExoU